MCCGLCGVWTQEIYWMCPHDVLGVLAYHVSNDVALSDGNLIAIFCFVSQSLLWNISCCCRILTAIAIARARLLCIERSWCECKVLVIHADQRTIHNSESKCWLWCGIITPAIEFSLNPAWRDAERYPENELFVVPMCAAAAWAHIQLLLYGLGDLQKCYNEKNRALLFAYAWTGRRCP